MNSTAKSGQGSLGPLTLDEFAPHSYEAWRDAAEKLLKGAPFEKVLIAPTYEGFKLNPIYRREDLAQLKHLNSHPGEGNLHRGNSAAGYKGHPWKVAQETVWQDPATFNSNLLRELKLGVTEIYCPIGGKTGLKADTVQDLKTAFAGVDLSKTPFTFEIGADAMPFAGLLFAYLETGRVNISEVVGCLANDPLGTLAKNGSLETSVGSSMDEMAALTSYAGKKAPHIETIAIHGQPYANGGCSSSQELGYVLATGLDYLREMQNRGLDTDLTARHMRLSLSIGPHFFMEIAKLRAARILWSRILTTMGGDKSNRRTTLHAHTGLTNKTLYDPHVNILRTSTEALSAVLGGCDSLTIAPFNELNPMASGPARRIARNMHTILADECNLNRVVDAGGGSYYLEWLTDQVARQAWKVFQTVEQSGGMIQALQKGIPQEETKKTAENKKKNVGTRKEKLVGSNLYPNHKEVLGEIGSEPTVNKKPKTKKSTTSSPAVSASLEKVSNLKSATINACVVAAAAGATLAQIATALRKDDLAPVKVEPIPPRRLAESYEHLRMASEAFEKATGQRPRILQINLGPSRRYRMRADWTSSFFQAGGLEVLNERDFDDANSAIEAARESRVKIAIITADDATYEAQAASLASGLKKKMPGLHLLLAGHPGDKEKAFREAGIDDFIHVRVNNYETLESLLKIVGALK